MLAGLAVLAVVAFQEAKPVWADVGREATNVFLRLSAHFTWDQPGKPVLRIAGASVYRARLNGVFAGHGPARTSLGLAKVDEWPLDGVRKGGNDLEIDVCAYNVDSFQYQKEPGFVQAEIVGGGRALASTPTGFAASELQRAKDGPAYSHQRNFPSERWRVGRTGAPVPLVVVPGRDLLPRGVPYPEFKVNRRFKLRPDGVTYELPFVDTGFIGVRVDCATPARLSVSFDEALVDGRLDLRRNGDPADSWHAMRNTVTWEVERPGVYELETIEPYALMYAQVKVESGDCRISEPWVRQLRNPHPEKVSFATSDGTLDAIFAAACNSLAENAVDLYTDCPGRERSAWLCDSRFTAEAAAWLTGDVSVECSQLENFTRTKSFTGDPKGPMSACFPGANYLSSYMLWYVLQCGDHAARAGGDADRFKAAVRSRILANLEFLGAYENSDGLLEDLPGFAFVEWSKANDFRTGVNYPVNALWCAALDCASRMYGLPELAAKAKRAREAIRRQSFDGRYFRDHAVRGSDGKLAVAGDRTETCQYYQFYFGVATPETHGDLWRRLTTAFGPGRTADGLHPSGLFFGRFLRLELLARDGRRHQLADEIKAALGEMARTSGTLWEFADGRDSRCHAFCSSAAVLLLRDVLGVRRIDRAGKTVITGGGDVPVDHGEVSLPVEGGRVTIAFGHEKGRLWRKVKVPADWQWIGGSTENLALGKPYELSTAPNYPLCLDPGDAVQLTDGIYSSGYFWVQRETVGWQGDGAAIVTVDLGRVEPISGFAWNCAAGAGGVPWPKFVNVYTSADRKTWTYVGDLLARCFARTGIPPEDRYLVYNAKDEHMPAVGRYVAFLVYANGCKFVDEVEVYRGDDGLLARPPQGVKTADPLKHYAFLRTLKPILADVESLGREAERTLKGGDLSAFKAELGQRKDKACVDDGQDWSNLPSVLPLGERHANVLALNARLLRKRGLSAPVVWTGNRWANLDPLTCPTPDDLAATPRVEMMRGETRSAAVNVTNPTDEPLCGTVEAVGLPEGARARCREVVFTAAEGGVCVSSAIRDAAGGPLEVSVPAGCTRQVWVTFDKPTGTAGTHEGKVRFAFSGKTLEKPLTWVLHDVDFPSAPRLHVGGWDYTDSPCRFGTRENLQGRIDRMKDFFTDTPMATSGVLPGGAKFGPDGALLNADGLDFRAWESWTSLHAGARLYMVVGTGGDKRGFMGEPIATPRFERMVADYYAAWARGVAARGVDPRRVVLHLVDEPAEESRARLQVALTKAIKKGAPDFRIFANPIYVNPREAPMETYTTCDILCPLVLRINEGRSAKFYLDVAREHRKELWLYSCSGPARLLDPSSYYRALQWFAWQMGAKGTCYWSFGCNGGGDSWCAWTQPARDYSPFFVSPDGTSPAKQSEAIREGVEDYELMAMLAEAVSRARTRGRDVTLAERILREGPRYALNQDEDEKLLTTPDSMRWADDKPRDRMDRVRIKALRALDDLVHDVR